MYKKMIALNAIRVAHAKKQRGVALAISLLLLVAMTIIGVSTLTGTRLNEQITSNAQQKAITFEAAESAISTVWAADEMMDAVEQFPDTPYHDPAEIKRDDLYVQLSSDYDQMQGAKITVDVAARVSIKYCGESLLPEGSSLSADESKLQMVGLLFDINGNASVDNSKSRSDHLQRGRLVRPKSGRTGDCIVRGALKEDENT
ncbi:MAG: pilus assembly PilX N-terminal domain-containing protein [Granulosicoccaceae bacterium]